MSDKDFYEELFFKSLPKLLGFGAAFLVGALLCIAIGGLLTGCTTYVPVETVRTEYRTNTVHDSILVSVGKTDSIVMREKGDTVFLERWHTEWKDRWRDRFVTDTLIKNDTIRVPYPVEGKVPKWEQVKLVSTGAVGGVCVLGIVGIALWLRRRYRRLDCT